MTRLSGIRCFLLLGALATAGAAFGQTVPAPTTPAQRAPMTPPAVVPTSTPALSPAEELLERYINPPEQGSASKSTVLVGRLPDGFTWSLPAGSRVIGSVRSVYGLSNPMVNTNVYLDVPASAEATIKQFEQTLGTGWQRSKGYPMPDQQGGFQPSDPAGRVVFIRQSPPAIATISAATQGRLSRVTVGMQEGGETENTLRFFEGQRPEPYGLIFPVLIAPPSSAVQPQGGGTGSDSVHQSVRIETSLSRVALSEYYLEQLKGAGWTLIQRTDVQGVSLTVWSFKQKERSYTATLSISGESPYRALLLAQAAD